MSSGSAIERAIDRIRSVATPARVGTFLIVTGGLVLFVSLIVPGLVDALLSSISSSMLTGSITFVILLAGRYLLVPQLRKRDREDQPAALSRPELETGASRGAALLGRDFKRTFSKAQVSQPWLPATTTPEEREINSTIREAAIDAYRRTTGVKREKAVDAIESGTWTDDPIAAATLATEDSDVELPATLWLRHRIDPSGAYRTRVERTTDEIIALEEETA